MADRVEFSDAIKRLVAERAGYRCSVPDCQASTIGPGSQATDVLRVGEAAHIFSASKSGPRGHGGLSPEALSSSRNCIWLCRGHSRIIDLHRGAQYPAEVLLSYKAQHEFSMARAIGSHPSPFGWIDEVTIHASPIIQPATMRFAQVNVIAGENGCGKTTLGAYVLSAVSPDRGAAFSSSIFRGRHQFSISFRTPALHRIDVSVYDGNVRYEMNGGGVPFNPFPFCVVELSQGLGKIDLLKIAGMTPAAMRQAIANTTIRFKGNDARFQCGEGERLDIHINDGFVPLRCLSAGEQKIVLIRVAAALAKFVANYRPTLLLLDDGLHGLDAHNRAECLEELGHGDCGYQTMLMDGRGARDIPWLGWQHIELGLSELDLDRSGGDTGPA